MQPIQFEQLPAHRRSLRLAVVTETYPPEVNGVAISLSRFAEGLRERNHDIQLIRPRQAGFDEMLTGGFPIPRYPDLKMGLPAKRALLKQWTLNRPDMVHIVIEGPAWLVGAASGAQTQDSSQFGLSHELSCLQPSLRDWLAEKADSRLLAEVS